MTLEEIEKELKIANLEYDTVFRNLPLDLSYQDFQKSLEPYSKKVEKLNQEKRLLKVPTFEELPNYGHTMSIDEFIECCKSGMFIDYDGHGNYIKNNMMSDITIYPSDIKADKYRKDFNQIIWFNR
jgi:hypothetical protein